MSLVQRPSACRRSAGAWVPVLLGGCALAAGPPPAGAQPGTEPVQLWLAESPAAGGARFGLGLDARFDETDDLEAVGIDTILTVTELGGRPSTEVLCRDPAEVNRRFDFGLEVRRLGVQVPIALPRLPLGGGAVLYPSLVVEAGTAEATLDFEDAEIPRSFDGRGVTYGGALETVATFGGGRWLLGAGYRFRTLRDVDLERSPEIRIAEAEAELGLDEHLATLRLGRLLAGGRVTPYLGVRARWSELDLDDEVSKVLFGGQVTHEERTAWRFENDSTAAVAGVDARLGGALVGRAEVGLGGDDAEGLLKLVFLPGRARPRPPWTPEEPAAEIAADFRALERELARAAEEIEPLRSTDPRAYLDLALGIVGRVEAEAVAVLERAGYSALADWFADRAAEARADLASGAPGRQSRLAAAAPGLALASFRGPAAPQAGDPADDWLARLTRAVRLVIVRADQRCLDIELFFTLEGAPRASMWIHLRGVPPTSGVRIRAGREPQRLRIGSYSYQVTVPGREPDTAPCVADGGGPLQQCPLDLASQPVRVVHCDFTDRDFEECAYKEPYARCAGPRP